MKPLLPHSGSTGNGTYSPPLGQCHHLLLFPDSQLNTIPFAALVDEQDRYLIETYIFTHLTTGRDLLQLQNPAASLPSSLLTQTTTLPMRQGWR
ncbi:CHAT domain-containing protein [Pseudanabaena sp. FACHB-2040]|uniref:CHAT domain-containing protein n=1 Tax=Pseudanabaena sp. FACHB-2040 TaxID=2692859 RepID=UPI001687FAAE|nr:CHAT domain-containing protein [Pseudanabaena sp. FACHB-2040]